MRVAVDIHVVGAGALGLSAALSLAEEGHDVVVHEQTRPGEGASSRAAGIVSTMTWNEDDFGLIQQTRGKIGELISMAMIEGSPAARHLWKPYDSILVAKDAARLDGQQRLLERHGEEPERLGWRQAQAAYPGLRFVPGEDVLVAQEDGAVEAGDLVQVLADRCAAEEVEMRFGAAVTDLHALDADQVVVAGGAWTHRLLAAHGVDLPIASFRTQLASVALPTDVPMVHDTAHGFYLRPESQQSILAGDGTVLEPHDPDAYDEATDPAFRESIAKRLMTRVHGAEDATIRSAWAGLCVATPDRRPLVGPVPDLEGVHVLTGDNGYGIMRCLALGDRLADAVRGDVHAETDARRFADVEAWQMQEGFGW